MGCDVRLGQKVVSIDEDAPAVSLETKETVDGDLILVADGKLKISITPMNPT